jgi:O-antigen ligase
VILIFLHRVWALVFAYTILVFSGAFLENALIGQGKLHGNLELLRALNSASYIPAYVAGLVLIFYSRAASLAVAASGLAPFIFFALLAVVANVWAMSLHDSIINSFQLVGTTIVAVSLSAHFSPTKFALYLSRILVFFLGASVIFVIFLPSLGTMVGSVGEYSGLRGVAQGVFNHKNQYAEIALIGGLLAISTAKILARHQRVLLLLLAIVGLVMAQSAGKALSFGLTVAFFLSWTFVRGRSEHGAMWLLVTGLGVLVTAMIVPVFMEQLLPLIGKDSTLTGRTIIWDYSFQCFVERPLLGYGTGSIWGLLPDYALFKVFRPGHSHNLYFEILLQLGLLGLCFVIWGMVRLASFLLSDGAACSLSPFVFVLFVSGLIRTPFEYTLFRDNSVGYLILLVAFGVAWRERYLSDQDSRLFSRIQKG